MNLCFRLRGVEHDEAPRLPSRKSSIPLAHPLMERRSFLLHAIFAVRQARKTDARRHIQQNRQVRHDAADRTSSHLIQPCHRHSSAKSLIRDRRVVKAVADDEAALPKRRMNLLFEELGASGNKQERFSQRRKRLQPGMKQDLAKPLT